MNKPSNKEILEALIASRKHWYDDCVMATKENYRHAQIRDNACACCQLFKGKDGTKHCEWCPVYPSSASVCCKEWAKTSIALFTDDFPAFHEASIIMWQKLDRLVGEYIEKVKEDEPQAQPDKCDTSAHDFEPKQQYEVGDVVLAWNGIECTEEFALYDRTLLIVFRKATREEAIKFLNKYYSRKIGDAWIRAYCDYSGDIKYCWLNEKAELNSKNTLINYRWLFNYQDYFTKAVSHALNIPIMPHEQALKYYNNMSYPYPDIKELENDN